MRWEEIEAGWMAMTRRVRADWPNAEAGASPVPNFLETGLAAVIDTKPDTPPPPGRSMP